MPYTIASDNFANVALNATVHNRTLNNALGGNTTLTFNNVGTQALAGDGAGALQWNSQVSAQAQTTVPSDKPVSGARFKFTPNGVQNGYRVGLLGSGAANVAQTCAELQSNGTQLIIRTVKADGTSTARTTVAVNPAPTAQTWLEIEKTLNNLQFTARLRDVASGNVLATANWTAPQLSDVNLGSPLGNSVNFGFRLNGSAESRVDDFEIFGFTLPSLTSPTGSASGSTTSQGSITTDIGNGTMYVATATADLTAAQIKALDVKVAVTQAGVVNPPENTGLTANTIGYKRQYVQVADVGESDVVRSAAFNTPNVLAAPAGSSATIVQGGTVIVRFTSTGGPVASATASIPVGSPANGAVAEPPKAMVNTGGNVWEASFEPVPGDYGTPAVLASNSDNPAVSITGATPFYIDDATGTATPADDTTAPVLTNPTLISDAPGFITAGASTDEPKGTGYAVVTNSTTQPTKQQVRDGLNNAGAAAAWSHNAVVSAVGPFTMRKAHSLGVGNWYAHVTQDDGSGNLADVVTSTAFAINDGTKPQMQGVVSLSNLTSTSYTTGCDAATDNVAATGYQVSLNGGTSWIEKGNTRTHNATGRTPGAKDVVQWRAYDAAGNFADAISRDVDLPLNPPVMTGDITFSEVTHEGFRATWNAATGTVSQYEVQLDSSTWVSNSNLLTRYFPALPETEYDLSVRAVNSGGNSNVLTKSVTTPAAPVDPGGDPVRYVGISVSAFFRWLKSVARSI